MKQLKVKIDGRLPGYVDRNVYVRAKTKQLREFGYPGLAEAEVDEQIDALLAGKGYGKGLTVIGGFMLGEVLEAL